MSDTNNQQKDNQAAAISMIKAGQSVDAVRKATGLSKQCIRSLRAERGIATTSGRRLKVTADQDAELRNAVTRLKPGDFGLHYSEWNYLAVQQFVKCRYDVDVTKDWVSDMRIRFCIPRSKSGRKPKPGNERAMLGAVT